MTAALEVPFPVLTVTEANFEADVLRAQLPVLLDVWAPWCEACRQLVPRLEQLTEDLSGKALIATMNIDDCRSLPRRLGIPVLPTLILFIGGRERARFARVPSWEELADLIQPAVST